MALTTGKLTRSNSSFGSEKRVYKAIITATPEKKSNSILCPCTLEEGYDSLNLNNSTKILLYLSPDSAAQNIKRGDEILFYGQPLLPKNNGNPDEFNYSRYLQRKGISGTVYVESGKWKYVSRTTSISCQEIAFNCRDYVMDIYKRLGFRGDELAVLSALTVGYKDELTEEIRESFSISGASHVLALSGLHVGLIFGLMFFVFRKVLGESKLARILRAILTVLLLWSFAFITGLSPSVVRSVFMFSLLALSQINSGRMLSVHTLSVAAFFMLIYNPMWIFDVGFQLSFIAVLGIVLIQPKLYFLVKIQNPVLKYFWGIITVSIAAQIATAPLVIFYFSRFSTHFLLTNLWVILLVTIIVYGAVIMLIVSPVIWLSQAVADVLMILIGGLNASVRWVESLPYSSFDNLWLHHWDVILFYLALLIFICLIISFKKKYVFAFIGCLFLITSHHLWLKISQPSAANIAFYNIRNCPVIHCINNDGRSWLVYADSVPNSKRLSKTLSNYWNRRGLDSPQSVITDMENKELLWMDNLLVFRNRRIYMLSDNRWDNKYSENPLNIDYLYISKGFTRNIKSVSKLFSARCIVLDSSIPFYQLESLKSECIELGYEYVLLNEKAFIIEC